MRVTEFAQVSPHARIADDVKIEAFAVIGDDVEIGAGSWIGPHVTIMDGVRIGKNCKIFPGAVVGCIPQDLKFDNEDTLLIIGDNVIIREYCTLNRGTAAAGSTVIGNNCMLMAYVHVAHDCMLANNVIVANSVNLAGHIEIDEFARIGGMTAVHQFVKIGRHAFVGGGSLVRKDIPPFVKAAREPLQYSGSNSIGMKRLGFSSEEVHEIEEIYRTLFVRGHNTRQAIAVIKEQFPTSAYATEILDFIENRSNRGLIRGYKRKK